MPNIFENEGDYHKWRIQYGVPRSFSISNVSPSDRAQEKLDKEHLFEEVLDLFSHDDIRQLLRENSLYPRINEILEKTEGMITEELQIIHNRLKTLIKHKQPSQVTKLFRYILEY